MSNCILSKRSSKSLFLRWIQFVFLIALMAACSPSEPRKEKPLVYEGMSKAELEQVLGLPNLQDTLGHMLDVNTNGKIFLERWSYDKRTVLIINDTVKNPDAPEARLKN